MKVFLIGMMMFVFIASVSAQTNEDSAAIRRAALDYIESQHNPDPVQMAGALHPRMVKRTCWRDKATGKDYIGETSTEYMILLAESYNKKGDKFPPVPKKEVRLLDVSTRTASVKLVADEWIDYMHLVKLNGEWKVINVLWQYHDGKRHE